MAKRLVLLRGLPGSGKTTLGREMTSKAGKSAVLLTTDDFFQQCATPLQVENLDKAQRWNLKRAETGMKNGQLDLIIIDDIHAQCWEMLPYVRLAVKYQFEVDVIQPQNAWSQNGLLCYALTRPPRLFSEEQVVEMAARWDHSIVAADQLISLVKPVSPRKDIPLLNIKVEKQVSVDEKQADSTPELVSPSTQPVSPLSLFELTYISLLNLYPAEEVDFLLANLYASDEQIVSEETEKNDKQASEICQEEKFVLMNFPANLHSQLSAIFTGGSDESEISSLVGKEIQCQIPLELAWQLFCCISQGQLFEQSGFSQTCGEEKEESVKFLRSDSKDFKSPSNLRDIMEEQLTHQWLFTRKLSSIGLNETSFRERFRLSLQLLSEKFVSLDRQSMEEIFLDNQCNFNQAYSTLCLLTAEQPTSLTKEEAAIIADESRPTFAFAATSAAKSSISSQEKDPIAEKPTTPPRLKMDPIIVVRKNVASTNDFDRPKLKYDENRFYMHLPRSVDHFEENSETRNEALNLRQRKRELVEMAKRLHERGLHTAASYYSTQVRDLGPKLAEFEEAAAMESIQSRNINVVKQNFIDLHGLKVREALKALEILIERKLKSPCQSRFLYAITGTGKHSEEGKARLRPAVVHYLRHSRKLSFTVPHSSVVKIDLLSAPNVQNASVIAGQFISN